MARRRRGDVDSLATSDQPRWLVLRDRLSRPIESVQLAPRVDQRAAMLAKRAALIADGWRADDLKQNRGFFFAERENDRVCVSVEGYEPGHAPIGHGSYLGYKRDT